MNIGGDSINCSHSVVFVANRGFALTSSRMYLIQHFLTSGWHVIVATADDQYSRSLVSMGVTLIPVAFNRGGINPILDFGALGKLIHIYRQYQPTLIHHFHAKPILIGSLAVKIGAFTKKVTVVNTVTGLGFVFTNMGLSRFLSMIGYQFLLRDSDATIFQNSDDLEFFVQKNWIDNRQARLIVSSGVDIEHFVPKREPDEEPIRILMVARLLWQKGIREFIDGATVVKKQYPNVRFLLAGEWDSAHPDAVERSWVESAVSKGTIEFLGYVNNMVEQLHKCDLFVLPSYYPEGVPRVLLEAASCGLPIITTDATGCREAVIDGQTGTLIPPKSSESLAQAIMDLLANPKLRHQMGRAGRIFMEEKFDIHLITERYLALYREIGVQI